MRYEQLNVGVLTVDSLIGAGAPLSLGKGDKWFIDPDGSDGSGGTTAHDPLGTFGSAHEAMVAEQNDLLYVAPGSYDLDEALVWSKRDTHLIGLSPAINQPRVDIEQNAAFTPMVTVSSRGSLFKNLTFEHGTAAADLIGMLISGRYNMFDNMYWNTPHKAAQDLAGYVGVDITGHNNYFLNCHFGGEAISRDQANYNLRIRGSGNVFENCFFSMSADGVAPFFINLDTADDRRYNWFKNCLFYVHWVNHVDQITYAVNVTGAGATSDLIFDSRCQFVGVDYICNVADSVYVWMASPGEAAATAFTGLGVRNLGT